MNPGPAARQGCCGSGAERSRSWAPCGTVPHGEAPWECLHAVLREWQGAIQSALPGLRALRLIEPAPAPRSRLHDKRERMRDEITGALRERPAPGLDTFTADLLTAAAIALDAAGRGWLRSGGTADRAALLDRAFALLSPAP
ncbi:hypothetical protein [Actinomadura rubrisoli]|uniref:MftR C-terminal domain-containing protein n=1 Tax=Actinomadura rubrisoli TaxID=2530368 RepID=A0A4R4ZY33_9ACTN|nr:hypothetical protein [Actinomadura rubrisoli]TDD63540.1 hypothetical protein E1298_43760 [Actinomadura rubrisoli]